ncbi:hypothetical protein FPV67DRAFT_1460073 [Lyophyllum atratum]|nr:hypothetical protein FPV67DRAFT_1460073 [Lyophyllum atratum]
MSEEGTGTERVAKKEIRDKEMTLRARGMNDDDAGLVWKGLKGSAQLENVTEDTQRRIGLGAQATVKGLLRNLELIEDMPDGRGKNDPEGAIGEETGQGPT